MIVLQTDICWANPKTNVQRLEAMIDRHGDADLIVLPEMFSTAIITVSTSCNLTEKYSGTIKSTCSHTVVSRCIIHRAQSV